MANSMIKKATKRLPIQVATGAGVLGASLVKTQIAKVPALQTLPKQVIDLLPALLGLYLSTQRNAMIAAVGDGMVAGAVAQLVGSFLPAGTVGVAGSYNYPVLAAPYNFPMLGKGAGYEYDSQMNTVAAGVFGPDSQMNTVGPSVVGYNGSMGRGEMPGVMGPSPQNQEPAQV